MAKATEPGAALAVKESADPMGFLVKAKPLPDTIAALVDVRAWADCLINREKYSEPKEGYLATKLLIAALNSESLFSEDDGTDVIKLQQWVTNVPGASTGPIEIRGLYVAPSQLSDDPWTYVLADFVHLDTGSSGTFSTGAQQVQGFLLKSLVLGTWPVQCQIKRVERTDRGGRHLFNVYPAFD